MVKKIFAVRARLVKGKRWYVDFTRFDPETGKETRHRPDFDLNDIEDLTIRELVGLRLVKYIDLLAPPPGGPATTVPADQTETTTLKEALQIALAAKLRSSKRRNSHDTYKSIVSNLAKWADQTGYASSPAAEFSKKHARAFMDFLIQRRKYRGRTLNNYRDILNTLWTEMVEREMSPGSPWKIIKPARQEAKTRRPFTPEERRIVADYIEKTDYWMFRGLLLQFFCYLRPCELARLKFKNFDLGLGVVRIPAEDAKTEKERWATIPNSILPYFRDGVFDQFPTNKYVFGLVETGRGDWEMQPSKVPANENRMYKRHRKVLERLKETGLLHDFAGLTWYSWKDTGISMRAGAALLATRNQAGHQDVKMTMVYYHAPTINPEYAALANDLYQ